MGGTEVLVSPCVSPQLTSITGGGGGNPPRWACWIAAGSRDIFSVKFTW